MESANTNREHASRDETPTKQEVPVNEISKQDKVSSDTDVDTADIHEEDTVQERPQLDPPTVLVLEQQSKTQEEPEPLLMLGSDKETVGKTSKQENLKIEIEVEPIRGSKSEPILHNDSFESASTKGTKELTSPQSPIHPPDSTSSGEPFRLILAGSEEQIHSVQPSKRRRIQLEVPDVGPKFYDIKSSCVSAPLIPARLPEAFESLPVFWSPRSPEESEKQLLREFVGGDLDDEEFEKLGEYCSADNLRTGSEVVMPTCYPRMGFAAITETKEHLSSAAGARGAGAHLQVIRKHRVLMEQDKLLNRRLKYRGVRFLKVDPIPEEEDEQPPLVPGKDLLFKVRFYRPFPYSPRERKRTGSRHPVFISELILLGRHTLADLRARIACDNDRGLHVDRSLRPDHEPTTSCKELFPSGFLFINNVFYNDMRPGCTDCSAPVREWARRKRIGVFPARDMAATRLDQLTIKLGYPEVYVHQGSCEHLFTLSEVRLVGPSDPLTASLFPRQRSTASLNSVYCTTCAEYPANWVVTRCPRVPFDPALFCDTCFRLYLYKGGEKLGDFNAVRFKGNEQDLLS